MTKKKNCNKDYTNIMGAMACLKKKIDEGDDVSLTLQNVCDNDNKLNLEAEGYVFNSELSAYAFTSFGTNPLGGLYTGGVSYQQTSHTYLGSATENFGISASGTLGVSALTLIYTDTEGGNSSSSNLTPDTLYLSKNSIYTEYGIKGLVLPNYNNSDRDLIEGPVLSQMIFNSESNSFEWFDGSAWISLGGGTSGWDLTGNSDTNSSDNYIGTSDEADLSIRTNATERASVSSNGIFTFNSPINFNAANRNIASVNNNVSFIIDTVNLNTAVGKLSLQNTTGIKNTAFGDFCMTVNTTGYNNTAVGQYSMSANTTGYYNTAVGQYALGSNTTGFYNTAVGSAALGTNTTGQLNVAVGLSALGFNTTGIRNTAIGNNALYLHQTGDENVSIGRSSFYNNLTGGFNTVVGATAGYTNASGSNNTLIGGNAGYNSSGSGVVAIGYNAAYNSYTGSNAIFIGTNAQPIVSSGDGQVNIGNFLFSRDGTKIGLFNNNPSYQLDVTGTGKFSSTLTVGAYTLPATDGLGGEVLQTDGSGNVSWASQLRFGAEDYEAYENRYFDCRFENTFQIRNALQIFLQANHGDSGDPTGGLQVYPGTHTYLYYEDNSGETPTTSRFYLKPNLIHMIVDGGVGGEVFLKLTQTAFSIGNIPEYASNAAALSGGLVATNVYHTAGVLKVVI